MGARAAIKRELVLEGLDCAGCAAKIEKNVKAINGVDECSVNFVTKTLTMKTDDLNGDGVVSEARQLINSLEPGIRIKDKTMGHTSKKQVLFLKGLDCANCAAKVEKHVNGMEGVTIATVDFVSKKLIIEAQNSNALSRIVSDAMISIPKIEPDIEVVVEQNSLNDEDGEDSGIKKMIFRLAGAVILGAIALIGDFGTAVELPIFIFSYLLAGGDILLKAGRNIIRGQIFDENFLMSIATIGAFAIGEYPEGIAVMLFFQVGELFQSIAVNRSRKSISDLMDIRPEFATLKIGTETKRVAPEVVNVGDVILVKPGEKIPLDGMIVEGFSMVDTSALTGESVPREVEEGNEVLSGFMNTNGVLTIQVTKEYSESTVAKILDLVQNASSRKAETEKFITRFARYYTPVVVLVAALLAVIPPLVIEGATFSDWIYRSLVFLVISCPCALVVSIPLGFFGGIGGASKSGILVKGSNYLEALNNVKYVVFDKTGTLTKGVFKVTDIVPKSDMTEGNLLEYAALAESYSNHPIAQSILATYGKEINKDEIASYDEIAGHGIKIEVNGKTILAGNKKLMHKEAVLFKEADVIGTMVHLAVDGEYAGYIVISDEVKEDSKKAIEGLKALGIKKTVMLTGDAKKVGEAVGQKLGLDEVRAELLPHEKVEQVELLDSQKQKNEKLIFVGDGINDTPVLARADIGIAMGGLGSDAAIEAADVVIMTDEPSKIVTAIKIAKRTRRIVWQNIIFALGTKGIVLLLGAFGLATMWEAIISDVGVTLLAVLNAMRALKVDRLS
ncbi:heavy metal translocating P-type ATPase [Cytobacillus sp. S13-E01]|uniref:heavy metal translocating P-type ATPase n=1 Tax=Cytobacillus sp. S13-E01 TaxID=3031326 RepID=UPI0023D8A032|nr:heavy metal translocating P-type ATPase [Cytobacillus sp. S13-E01]MDF0727876.1 heavy metal translocating P-type ATPase [Cytobacillus sp. S13-E01]